MSTSFTARWNEAAIDENYEKWSKDPSSVSPDWASFFEGFELGFARDQKAKTGVTGGADFASRSSSASGDSTLHSRVEALIYTYRTLGHTASRLNPLSEEIPYQPQNNQLPSFAFSLTNTTSKISSVFAFPSVSYI